MSKNEKLWIAWGCMYALCTACGFLPVASGALKGLFLLFSLGFFIPGGMLLFNALKNNDHRTLKTIRVISILSLVLTVSTIVYSYVYYCRHK